MSVSIEQIDIFVGHVVKGRLNVIKSWHKTALSFSFPFHSFLTLFTFHLITPSLHFSGTKWKHTNVKIQILEKFKSSLIGEMERLWEKPRIFCKVIQKSLFYDLLYTINLEDIKDEAYVVGWRKLTENKLRHLQISNFSWVQLFTTARICHSFDM